MRVEAPCIAIVDRDEGKRRLFLFRTKNDGIYWIAYDIDGNDNIITPALSSWVKTAEYTGVLLGVMPYFPPPNLDEGNNGYLYIFLRTSGNNFAFTRTAITSDLAVDKSSQVVWDELKHYNPNWPHGDRGVVLRGPVGDDNHYPNVPCIVVLLPQKIDARAYTPGNSNAVIEIPLNKEGTQWGNWIDHGNLTPQKCLLRIPAPSAGLAMLDEWEYPEMDQ